MILLSLGAGFAAANVWVTALRSTIPRQLDGTVTGKNLLLEKTPGVDDVYRIAIGGNLEMTVDRAVFDAVEIGQPITKRAWAFKLDVDGVTTGIGWSLDFRRMRWLMPIVVVLLVFVWRSCVRVRYQQAADLARERIS